MRQENNQQQKTYKILVRTLQGNILTFHTVKEYTFEGYFLKFIDAKRGDTKRFPISNCEIEETTVPEEGRI